MGRVSRGAGERAERPNGRRRSSCRWWVRCRRTAAHRGGPRSSRRTKPLDLQRLETTIETFAGLDRYETVGWQLEQVDGRPGLRVEARPKSHAPPFLMLGVSLQNTTSDDFGFRLAARYLTFDVARSGSELRVDGAVGAQPGSARSSIGQSDETPFFAAGNGRRAPQDDQLRERRRRGRAYSEVRVVVGLDVGVNLGRDSDVRLASAGRPERERETGDPGLPELDGRETRARLAWRYDTQDSPVVPSSGVRALANA